jgi:hypothetical protein
MTRGIAYSKPLAAAAAAAVFATSAMCWLHTTTNTKLSELRKRDAAVEDGLGAQIAAMAPYENGDLETLRAQVGRYRTRLGSKGTWDRLVRRLGSGWIAESGPKYDKSGYSIQLGTFKLVSHAVSDWPEIVNVVKELETIPGVGISEFSMKTSGSGNRRTLDTASIAVVIQADRDESNRPTAP